MKTRNKKVEQRAEKILAKSPGEASNAELLAILLGEELNNRTGLAQQVLKQFGGFRKLLTASAQELVAIQGLNCHHVGVLKSILEVTRRYLEEVISYYPTLGSSEITKQYLKLQLRELKSEVFACMFLNIRNQLIRYESLFQGTIDMTTISTRIVLQKALEYNAAAVIFAHNHPSGRAIPSEFDKLTTQQLVKALALVSIRVNDHLIVGEGEIFSFADAGLLD